MTADTKPWPTEIRLAKDKKSLTVAFSDGESHDYTAEYLRIVSPSAEVQGHSPSQRQTIPGKRNIEIMKIEPVGNYAIRLTFTDLHDSGIYSWDYLSQIARDHDFLWGRYKQEMEEKGLSRDPS